MYNILMVCLGNICRSPLAEGILQHKLPNKIKVDSCGTAAYHIGEKPDKRSILVAQEHGIDISGHRARQFSPQDWDSFDRIYCMDSSNYNDILSLATTPLQQEKVRLLLDENPDIENKNVPDPYYGGVEDFRYVYQLLNDTLERMVQNFR